MDGKRDAELPPVGLDLFDRVAFADDTHEADALLGEPGRQLIEHGGIVLREWTGRVEERETDGPAVRADEIGERNGPAVCRSQREAVRRKGGGRFGRQDDTASEARKEPE